LPSIADVLLRCREQAVWASDEDRPFCQLPIILVHTRYSAGFALALQLPFPKVSESMGNHDSKIVGAGSVD
jgi:hypothetical protein